MAQTTVIREFLVALGYKHDETAAKKLKDGITSVTKAVEGLGVKIEATALAVAYGVARFASNLEALYFAAQRTGSSASSLKAFDLAARNFGASIEEAQGSVEGLAAFLRNNPGGQAVIAGWLASVGLGARNAATGAQLTGTALLAQIGRMFQIMREHGRTFQANQLAGLLGISDRTMLAISQPGFQEELSRQDKRVGGWQKAAEAAHRFEIQLQDVKLQFQQLLLGFEEPALAALRSLLTKFSRLIKDHGKQIVTDLAAVFGYVIDGIGQLLDFLDKHGREAIVRLEALFLDLNLNFTLYVQPVFGWIATKLVELDRATDGWSSKLLTVYTILKLMGATGLVTGILSLAGGLAKAFGGIAAAAVGESTWAAAGVAFGGAAAIAIAGAVGVVLGRLIDKALPTKAVDFIGEKGADAIDAFMKAVHFANAAAAADPGSGGYPSLARDARSANLSTRVELNMTISSNGHPQTIAQHISDEYEATLKRINAELVREFSSVVR